MPLSSLEVMNPDVGAYLGQREGGELKNSRRRWSKSSEKPRCSLEPVYFGAQNSQFWGQSLSYFWQSKGKKRQNNNYVLKVEKSSK